MKQPGLQMRCSLASRPARVVHVYEGGQAVVGAVEVGGGGSRKTRERPHARQIAYAPESALPSPNAGGCAVPAGRDEERALQDARGDIRGRSMGNSHALKHGRYAAEAITERRKLAALLREARALVEMVGSE